MDVKVDLLVFHNKDASPKTSSVLCDYGSVPFIMAMYGAYYSGDRYEVRYGGEKMKKDHNGELLGHLEGKQK